MDINRLLENFEICKPTKIDSIQTIKMYEALSLIMPNQKSGANIKKKSLMDVIDSFDGFILDGFGVINLGNKLIEGVLKFLIEAKKKKKHILILTNGSTNPSIQTAKKYKNWNLPINLNQVISPRDALEKEIAANAIEAPVAFLGNDVTPLKLNKDIKITKNFHHAETFIFLGSRRWSEREHCDLVNELIKKKRNIFVANPDISAPHGKFFSPEPGYWSLRLMKEAKLESKFFKWFGKPHYPVFDYAMKKLNSLSEKKIDQKNIAMIGDTLHTDVLGANSYGFKSILLTNYGLMNNLNVDKIIKNNAIYPDLQVKGF